MLGIVVLAAFELFGVLQAWRLFSRRGRTVRLWLGMVMGLMEMMWLPSLFAFALDFTLPAQRLALLTSALAAVGCAFIRPGERPLSEGEAKEEPPLWLILCLVVPAMLVSGYLQYTHMFREVDGALYVGQSTYGDLCMHASFATGLIGQSYPPEYSILPGTRLGYPFLVDALSATMLIYGTPLAAAFSVPGTLMTGLIWLGFVLFTWEMTEKKSAVVIAFVLLFFNGGLGFLGTLDRVTSDPTALNDALNGYYQTPTNMPDVNLRWVNALCDLLVPQRTLMAGWLCVLPALYLLVAAMRERRAAAFLAVGLWAGPMPMIHTHSFLALGVISLGAMIDCLLREKKQRLKTLLLFGLYGATACALALPQLIEWTFPQTVGGGSLRILFNWVNNDGNGGLKDEYFWFWIKNVGLVYLIFPLAALTIRKPAVKALSLGCLLLYALAETVVFQPNVYDNNKLFFVAFLAMLPAAAEILTDIYARLKGIRGRCVLAAAFILASTLSGAITIVREAKSEYQIFGKEQVEAAAFVRENTLEDGLFLTATNHNNAPAVLAGRKIVCGADLYLYFHGVDYAQRAEDARRMLADPAGTAALYEEYGVDYVFFSSYEAQNGDLAALKALYPLIYEGGAWYDEICIFAVSPRAQAAVQAG